jgi:hypothetical protein
LWLSELREKRFHGLSGWTRDDFGSEGGGQPVRGIDRELRERGESGPSDTLWLGERREERFHWLCGWGRDAFS